MTVREVFELVRVILIWWCSASIIAGLLFAGINLLSKRKFKE